MKERPILFSAPMVLAILEERKTQTRRIVKPQPIGDLFKECGGDKFEDVHAVLFDGNRIGCPYGQTTDQLWVRENFSGPHCMESRKGCAAVPPGKWARSSSIWYWADGYPQDGDWTKPRPSIHMPRWASRINLEITWVRVERLQDISEADAQMEGADCLQTENCDVNDRTLLALPLMNDEQPYRNGFALLWESINGPGSWDANPWVWRIEFRRIEA